MDEIDDAILVQLIQKGEFDDAIAALYEMYEKVQEGLLQESAPSWLLATIYANIGYCQARLGQWGKAVAAYNDAHDLDPDAGWNFISEQIQEEM